jgi:peptide/nickel transport system ATP-binding protein
MVEQVTADDLRVGNVQHAHTRELRSLSVELEEPA